MYAYHYKVSYNKFAYPTQNRRFKIMTEFRNVNSSLDNAERKIQKLSFEPKRASKDGSLLQVVHTVRKGRQERSCRFSSASFDITGERIAVSDPFGKIFLIDLLLDKYWALPNSVACNFIKFSYYVPRRNEILIGSVNGPLIFINVDTGETTGELIGHEQSPLSVSFADDEPFCLSTCSHSAIIWDLRYNTLLHQLTLRSSIGIKKVMFMPVTNHIMGLFEDNSLHVWKLENLECMKQIFPDEWGGPTIKAVAFTRNGRGMVIGGQSAMLAVFLLDNWTLQKLIALPEKCKGVKHIEFIPQLFDAGANKILAVLTTSNSVMFVDTETSVMVKKVTAQLKACVSRFDVSPNGKYLATVVNSGAVNLYCCHDLIKGTQNTALFSEAKKVNERRPLGQRNNWTYNECANLTLNQREMHPFLREFGEYPEGYRSLIWKLLLRVPGNQAAFVALINKGIHPAFASLETVFNLTDRSLFSSLKRLLSCLAYWSPIFIQVRYLPIFVLPFVRIFRHDQFTCFELVATIIVSLCKGWFEFVPFPPVTVLEKVNGLLEKFDNELHAHFAVCNVTPDLYIWSLLETGFYEVLGWVEWQQLWDHIITKQDQNFLMCCVLAFIITCRSTLLRLQQIQDFEHFFRTEAVINMKQLREKAYQLFSKVGKNVNQVSLSVGMTYQMFTDYPKELLDQQLNKLSSYYDEQAALESQQFEIEKQKEEIDLEKKSQEETKLKQVKLKEMEEAYKRALKKEDRFLDDQRKSVSTAWRSLREKEAVVRSQALDRTFKDKAGKYAQLEKLVNKIESKKGTSEHQSNCSWVSSYQSSNPTSLRLQHASVVHHLSKLKKLCRLHMAHPQLKICINKFEDLLGRIDKALEREQSSKQQRPCHEEQIMSLEEETQALEEEAQKLLQRLSVDPELAADRCTRCCAVQTTDGKGEENVCYRCGFGIYNHDALYL